MIVPMTPPMKDQHRDVEADDVADPDQRRAQADAAHEQVAAAEPATGVGAPIVLASSPKPDSSSLIRAPIPAAWSSRLKPGAASSLRSGARRHRSRCRRS